MAGLTGLFQRSGSYYLRVVLPQHHPLKNKYKNGKFVESLGPCSYREAILKGTIRRAEILLLGLPQTSGVTLATFDAKPTASTGGHLRDVHTSWKSSKSRSADSIAACLRAVTLFETFTKNPPLHELTRPQGEAFREWLEHPDRKTTSKTARDRLIWVKSLLEFAANDLGLIRRSPWIGIDIQFKTTNKRRPWTEDELKAFFTQPLYSAYLLPDDRKAGHDAAYWIPLLGLFTGARVGELAQLRITDIETTSDVPMLSITNEGDQQQVKTTAGIRKVPIHPELVRLGFLDYVATMQVRGVDSLWPGLPIRQGKPGGYFSHWFGTFRKAIGFGKNPDFHCFRHTVRSHLANAGIAEAVIDTLVGHEVSGSTGAKVYTHRTPKTLADAIEVLAYPALALPRVYKTPKWPHRFVPKAMRGKTQAESQQD